MFIVPVALLQKSEEQHWEDIQINPTFMLRLTHEAESAHLLSSVVFMPSTINNIKNNEDSLANPVNNIFLTKCTYFIIMLFLLYLVMELHCELEEQLAVLLHVAGTIVVQLKHISVSAERQ